MAAKTRQPKKSVTADLSAMIKGFPALFSALEQEHKQITASMIELERAGLKRATLFWRKKTKAGGEEVQFLYLHHPATSSSSGQRGLREYIGSDPAKIKSACAAVERVKEYDALADKARSLESRLDSIREALDTAKSYLENKPGRSRWGSSYSGRYSGASEHRYSL